MLLRLRLVPLGIRVFWKQNDLGHPMEEVARRTRLLHPTSIHPSRFSPRDLRFGSASNVGARCWTQACTKWKLQPNIATICNYYTVTSSNICFFSAHWLSGEPSSSDCQISLIFIVRVSSSVFAVGQEEGGRSREGSDVVTLMSLKFSEVQPGNRKN